MLVVVSEFMIILKIVAPLALCVVELMLQLRLRLRVVLRGIQGHEVLGSLREGILAPRARWVVL
jgi:hypothetical protein